MSASSKGYQGFGSITGPSKAYGVEGDALALAGAEMLITSPPNRLPASSNEERVRVEFSQGSQVSSSLIA
jgi:hypothetical protein